MAAIVVADRTGAPVGPELASRPVGSVLWRNRRDGGLDRCMLSAMPSGWRLSGTALLAVGGVPCEVRYTVMADDAWRTRQVGMHVQGLGEEDQRLALTADGEGSWLAGKEPVPALAGALDVDMAVTAATNTLAIRRSALTVGEVADLVVVYVRFPELTLEPMQQRYERVSEDVYHYSKPGFAAQLRVDDEGLVLDYEGAWESMAHV